MEIGFNNQWPIIATVMNSMDHANRYPIIHLVMYHKTLDNGVRAYYLTFEQLVADDDLAKVKEFKQELMKFVAENSNLDLPYLIDDKYYKFSDKGLIPGRKYSLLPVTVE